MIASIPTTSREPIAPAPALRGHPGHAPGRGPHARDPLGDLATALPGEASVLWLGPIEPEARAAIESRGGRLLEAQTEATAGPVELADLDRLDLGRGRFDLAVARDVLGRVRDPGRLLESLRRSLRPGGRLAATVPDAAHPVVRQALERGGDPYGPGSPLDPGQARLFTRETLAEAVEGADFVVARIAAEVDGSGAVLAWTVLAYALPVPGLAAIQERGRQDAFARDEAEREALQLRLMLEDATLALDSAHRRDESLRDRERSLRDALDEAQAALLERDAAFLASTRDLLYRLEEVEPLRRERDAAHRHALAAEARCRSLELRAEHVLMEFPRRIARRVRSALRRTV